jgi:hypothetical protein
MSDKEIVVEGSGPFVVRVRGGGSETRHEVSLSGADAARAGADPARLIRAAFAFLLDREPREAILACFDFSAISRYFPEFERELPRYLDEIE